MSKNKGRERDKNPPIFTIGQRVRLKDTPYVRACHMTAGALAAVTKVAKDDARRGNRYVLCLDVGIDPKCGDSLSEDGKTVMVYEDSLEAA